jgi:hypothetical protein
VTSTALVTVLRAAGRAGVAVCLWGDPGIGTSALIHAAAAADGACANRDRLAPETAVFEVEQYLDPGMYAHAAALASDLEAPPLASDDCCVAGREQVHYALIHLHRRTFTLEAPFDSWPRVVEVQRST